MGTWQVIKAAAVLSAFIYRQYKKRKTPPQEKK